MTPESKYVFRAIAIVLVGLAGIVAAAGQPGGPWEGMWFVAPVVALITAIAVFIRNPEAGE